MILASWLALAAPVTLDADVPQAASSGDAAAVPAAAAATPRNDLRFMAERSAVMSGTTSHPAFWSGGRPSRNGRPRGGCHDAPGGWARPLSKRFDVWAESMPAVYRGQEVAAISYAIGRMGQRAPGAGIAGRRRGLAGSGGNGGGGHGAGWLDGAHGLDRRVGA